MMSKPQQCEPKLFYHGISLDSRVPQDHSLRRIQQRVDFAFVRSQVEHLYGRNGQVSVDPTVLLKLMFLMFYENIKSERAMMAQLPLRLDWLWFCGYDLDDRTPDHSVLSKARRRWGQKAFSEFFAAILQQCIDAGLVDGTTIHIDSSMIDGNVSKDTLRPQLRLLGQNLYDDLETQSSQTPQEDIPLAGANENDDPESNDCRHPESAQTDAVSIPTGGKNSRYPLNMHCFRVYPASFFKLDADRPSLKPIVSDFYFLRSLSGIQKCADNKTS